MTGSMRYFLLGSASLLSMTVFLSSNAVAQTDNFSGGGSSLAAKVYTTAGSIYGANVTGFVLNYGTSSSGTGTTAFINNANCGNYAGSTGPGSNGCPGSVADFAASDSYLSGANFSALTASTSLGLPVVQIPMFATAVTIAFNIPGFTTDGSVNFTDNDLGLIFSGQVTNLNSPLLSQNSSTTLTHFGSQPITVVYRSDGSGTSNLFTTHLANVLTPTAGPCTSGTPTAGQFYSANFGQGPVYPYSVAGSVAQASTAVVASLAVTGNNAFSAVFTGSSPGGGCGFPASATFSGQSGSGQVQSKILSTPGAIGYLSPDYTDIAPINGSGTPSSSYPPVASVNGILPTAANTSAALAGLPTPSTVAQYQNPENFAPLVASPSAGYPIVGYTYWFLDQCYAATSPNQASDIKGFLSAYFGTALYANLVTLNGFAPISTSGGIGKVITKNILANNNGANIDIGNASVCAGGKGR